MNDISDLRDIWVNHGYNHDAGSATVTYPPPNEYVRVYHLTSAKYALSNLSLERLKVARFSDVNDPFELMALNLREKRSRKVLREFKDAYSKHTGLLCFSADWTNPVLWSHYGARHRGICLGFDLHKSLACKVIYEDKRILEELPESEDPNQLSEELQSQLVRTKFSHWNYEEEYRVFVPLKNAIKESDIYFYPFGDSLRLAEVILGPNCRESLNRTRNRVQKLQPDVTVYKSRLAFKHFKVVPDGRSVPKIDALSA